MFQFLFTRKWRLQFLFLKNSSYKFNPILSTRYNLTTFIKILQIKKNVIFTILFKIDF